MPEGQDFSSTVRLHIITEFEIQLDRTINYFRLSKMLTTPPIKYIITRYEIILKNITEMSSRDNQCFTRGRPESLCHFLNSFNYMIDATNRTNEPIAFFSADTATDDKRILEHV